MVKQLEKENFIFVYPYDVGPSISSYPNTLILKILAFHKAKSGLIRWSLLLTKFALL